MGERECSSESGKIHTLRVDIDCLLACDRVGADNGVLVHDGVAAVDASTGHGGGNLLDTRVSRFQTVEALLEEWGKAVVGLDCVDEEGVTAGLGLVENVKECGSGWLLLVRDVRMPGD